MGHPSLASEFPNDNAEISRGAIWIHAGVVGPATAEVAPFEPVPGASFVLCFDDEPVMEGPVDVDIVEGTLALVTRRELEDAPPSQATTDDGDESSPAPEPDAPAFTHFERALTAALLARGSTRAAALVPRLLRLEPLAAESLSKEVHLTLQSRGYLDGNGRYSPKYREICGAWSALLQGASQDFSACGTTTLDRFGAELLAALLAVPLTRADELRRELRKAGIAAFGVLEATAA